MRSAFANARSKADRVEIADILRDVAAVRTLAVNEGQLDRGIVDVFEADKVGGLAASVIVEDDIVLGFDLIEGAVLDGFPIAVFVHRFLVQRNAGPIPRF